MSSYRPKSLDELNSRYDQAMSADIAIKKGVSGIKESENQQKGSRTAKPEAFDMEAEGFSRKAASVKNVEDISGAVDDFIRHLNKEYAPEPAAQRPQPDPVAFSQRTSPKKPTAVEPAPINDERSELLDNYMKVMTDQYEDDEELSARPSGVHLKKKSRKRRKEKTAEPVSEQPPVIPDKSEPMPLPEVDYNHAGYLMKNAEPLPEEPQNAGADADMSFKNLDSAFDQLDEQSAPKTQTKKNKSRIVLRTLFSLLLAVVIVATAAVASLVLVLKVNTGSVVFDKYYFVTTSASFEEADLNSGDLVVCEAEDMIEDERFVLCVDRNAGSFFFGKKNGEMIDDAGNKLYLVDGQSIYEDNILGTVKRSFGNIGTVIDTVFRFYIPLLGLLLILAVGLILIVTIGLRNKNKYIVGSGENEEEQEDDGGYEQEPAESEQPQQEAGYEPPDDMNGEEEEPEPEKKSRKKKRRKEKKQRRQAESDDETQNEEAEEEESDNYSADFDSYSDI